MNEKAPEEADRGSDLRRHGKLDVTRKRVPDRDEQGKPSKDARRGRCHPLEAGIYPCG